MPYVYPPPPEEDLAMRIAPSLPLTDLERQQLTQWARGRRTPARLVLRAKVALLAAEGHTNQHIAAALATSRQTVGLWRHRVATQRLPASPRTRPAAGGLPSPARRSSHAF
jgi:DNA-binding NarL/FixJ family response regulator